MDTSVIFVRHFAQLVWLLLHEPDSIEEQKAALRALVIVTKDAGVSLALHGDALQANGILVPVGLTGVADVAGQMRLHGLAMIMMDLGAAAAHVLGVARILAGMPTLGDDGAAAEAQRLAIGASSVRFAAKPRISQLGMIMPEMEFGDVLDDPLAEAAARATPRSTQAIPTPSKSHDGLGGLFAQFTAPRTPTESPDALLKKLDAATDATEIMNLVDDLVVTAEAAAREKKSGIVSDVMSRLVRREAAEEEHSMKRAFAMAVRRLSKPEPLRCITMQLALHPSRRDDYVAILARAGEDGADALIEQIGSVAHQRDRHVYFGALIQLKAGVTSLMHMLSDSQWFVVRNAAEMLGEMQVRDAEKPLTDLLKHEDERVRRAASGALMRLGTARSMQAIQAGLADPSPSMRSEAAAALVTRNDGRSVPMLLQALDAEKDEEVKTAILLALGKLATQEAVQRLIKGAEVERGLFKRKTTAYRIAAIHGLAEARTMEAADALRALRGDKDTEVRDAARFALGRITQRPTMGERPALS